MAGRCKNNRVGKEKNWISNAGHLKSKCFRSVSVNDRNRVESDWSWLIRGRGWKTNGIQICTQLNLLSYRVHWTLPFLFLHRTWRIRFWRQTSGSSTSGKIINSSGTRPSTEELQSSTFRLNTFGFQISFFTTSKWLVNYKLPPIISIMEYRVANWRMARSKTHDKLLRVSRLNFCLHKKIN